MTAPQTTKTLRPHVHKYECASGHYQTSLNELTFCQAYVKGKPCPGELRKVR